MTPEEAEQLLKDYGDKIVNAMVETGWEVIGYLIQERKGGK